ncbi:hypothetical protein ES705_24461 [subsurface metagenome]
MLTGIEVDPKTMSLFVGEKDFFKVTANYSDDTAKNVTNNCVYTPNDTTIANLSLMDPGALQKSVKAVGEGTTKISVYYEGQTDTLIVKVNPILLTSIVVDPETMDLIVGESEDIVSVTAHYNFGPTKDIALAKCDIAYNPSTLIEFIALEGNNKIKAIAVGTDGVDVSYTEGDITERDNIIVTVIDLVQNIDTGEYYHTIQAAINADSTLTGHTIEVAAGTYAQSATTLTIEVEGLTLRSIDGVATTTITSTSAKTAVLINGANNVTVDGFTVENSSGRGIEMTNLKDATIQNNVFTDGGGIAINLGASVTGVTVSGNTVEDSSLGIYLSKGASDNTIENNTITGTYNASEGGIDFGGNNNDNIITGNTITDGAGSGIYFFALEDAYNGNLIEGNTISGNADCGIEISIWGTGNVIISNNIVDNGFGIKADDGVVVDATDNWWGKGDTLANTGSPEAEGNNGVSDNVNYEPWSKSEF